MGMCRLAGLVIALGVVLSGCVAPTTTQSPTSGAAAAPKAGPRRMVIGQGGVFSVLNQMFDSNTGKFVAAENLWNSKLTSLDDKNQTVAVLAEAVPTVENGLWKVLPDGTMETRWTIRAG